VGEVDDVGEREKSRIAFSQDRSNRFRIGNFDLCRTRVPHFFRDSENLRRMDDSSGSQPDSLHDLCFYAGRLLVNLVSTY
jgi:hypothetical protein